ncbi:MAG: PEGA domain-containing protein [Polyangiales bacterium]
MRRWGWVWLAAALASWALASPVALAQDASESDDEQADEATAQDAPSDAARDEAAGEEGGAEPTEEERAAAREAYGRGQEAFENGDYEEAEAAFEEAYAQVANPVVLVSLAESRARQDDVRGAIEAYERYLEERPDAPDKGKIEGKLETLRETPGTLKVTSKPPDAAITLDGEPLQERTPAELEVDPGEYTVALSMDGYEPTTETVEMGPAGEQELEITLEAAAAPEEEALGTGKQIAEPEPEPEPADSEEEGGISTGVWVATGVAAAGLVSGTVLGFMSLTEESDFNDMPTESGADRGERLALFADVSFGLAAAAAITGLVLYFTDQPTDNDEQLTDEARRESDRVHVDVSPALGADGAGGAVRVSF